MRAFLSVALAAWAWARPAEAQLFEAYDKRIAVGTRVRLQHPDSARMVEGEIRSVYEGLVEVREPNGRYVTAALRDLETIQIRERGSGPTIALGTLGFVTGSVLYLKWCRSSTTECYDEPDNDRDGMPDEPTMFTTMVMGTTMLFGLIGHALTPPTWNRINVRVDLSPSRNGSGLGLGLRFRF